MNYIASLKLTYSQSVFKYFFLLIVGCRGLMFSTEASCQDITVDPLTKQPTRHVYIPWEEIQSLIQREQGGVLLTKNEYAELLQLIKQAPDEILLPEGTVITSASYAAKVIQQQLVIEGKLRIVKPKQGWAKVPFILGGMSIESARINNKPALISLLDPMKQVYELILSEPGNHELSILLSAPLKTIGSDKQAIICLPDVPAAEFSLALMEQKELHLNGLTFKPTQNPTEAKDPKLSQFIIPVGGMKQLELKITDATKRDESDSLIFANSGIGVEVFTGESLWSAMLDLQIYGKEMNRLTFRVPRTLEVTSVEASGMEAWELKQKPSHPDETTIELIFRQKLSQNQTVKLQGISTTSTGEEWKVPHIILENAVSQAGRMLVKYSPNLRLKTMKVNGVRPSSQPLEIPLDSKFQPGSVEQQVFDIWKPDYELSFITLPKAQQLQAVVTSKLSLEETSPTLNSIIQFRPFFAPLFSTRLTLPVEWTCEKITINSQTLTWKQVGIENNRRMMEVTFPQPIASGQRVNINLSARKEGGDWPVKEQPVSIDIPQLYLSNVDVVEGTIAVSAPKELNISPLKLIGLDLKKTGVSGERAGFQYQDKTYAGVILVERKPSQLSAVITTLWKLMDEKAIISMESKLVFEGGGIDLLQVELPEAAGNQLRFNLLDQPVQIVEQTYKVTNPGVNMWSLKLDKRLLGQARLRVNFDLPLVHGRKLVRPHLNFPQSMLTTWWMGVISRPDEHIIVDEAVDQLNSPLTLVDPVDFPMLENAPSGRMFVAYRSTDINDKLMIHAQSYDKSTMATVISTNAEYQTLLDAGEGGQHHLKLTFQATGLQSLYLSFPEGSQMKLWSVLLNGTPVEIRKSDSSYEIPLGENLQTAQQQQQLDLYYVSEINSSVFQSAIQEVLPRLIGVMGSGQEVPVIILNRTWDLFYPPDTELIGSDGVFTPATPIERPSLLGDFFVNPGDWSWSVLSERLWMFCLITGGVVIMTAAFKRSLTIGIFSIFILFICSVLLMPAVQQTREAARRSEARRLERMLDSALQENSDNNKTADPLKQDSLRSDVSRLEAKTNYESSETSSNQEHVLGNDYALPQSGKELESKMDSAPEKKLMEQQISAGEVQKPGAVATPAMTQDDRTRGINIPFEKNENYNKSPESSGQTQAFDNFNISGGNAQPTLPPVISPFAHSQNTTPVDNIQALPQITSVEKYKNRGTILGLNNSDALNSTGMGGLLSVCMSFDVPATHRVHRFVYHGVGNDRQLKDLPKLSVNMRQAKSLTTQQLLSAMCVIFLCWWMRKPSLINSVGVAVAAIMIPIATAPLATSTILGYLEGMFMGGVMGLFLQILYLMYMGLTWCCKSIVKRFKESNFYKLGFMSVCLCTLVPNILLADEPAKTLVTSPLMPVIEDVERPELIIPLRAGETPLSAEMIYLPPDKFKELWLKAHPDLVQANAASKLEPVICELIASAKVNILENKSSGFLEINYRAVIQGFSKNPKLLKLPFSHETITSAKLNDQPASFISGDKQSPLQILVTAAGINVLDVTQQLPIKLTGETGQFSINHLYNVVGKVTLELPAKGLIPQVNQADNVFRMEEQGEKTVVEIPWGLQNKLDIRWQPKFVESSSQQIVQSEAHQTVGISDAGILVHAQFDVNVRQGTIQEVEYRVPLGLRLQSLSGKDIGGWQIESLPNQQSLKVYLRRPVGDATRIQVAYYLKSTQDESEGTVVVPEILPWNVTRSTGKLVIQAEEHFLIFANNVKGLRQISAQAFPGDKFASGVAGMRQQSPRLYYEFLQHPYEMSINYKRKITQLKGEVQHLVYVGERKIEQKILARVEAKGQPISAVVFKVPQGFLPLTVTSPSINDWFMNEQGDKLVVEFQAPKLGVEDIIIVGAMNVQMQEQLAERQIELLSLENIEELSQELDIWVTSIFDSSVIDSGLWKGEDIQRFNMVQTQTRQTRLKLPNYRFTQQGQVAASIRLKLERSMCRCAGDIVTLAAVSDTSLDYGLTFRVKVQQGSLKTIAVEGPKEFARKVSFSGDGIQRVEETLGENHSRWLIFLEHAVQGEFLFTSAITMPPAKTEISVPRFKLGSVPHEYLEIDRQSEYLILVNLSGGLVTAKDVSSLEYISKNEIPLKLEENMLKQAAEIGKLKATESVKAITYQIQRFASEENVAASVNIADLTTILTQDGSWRTKGVYTIKNWSRQYLPVKLPEGSRILSVMVRDQSSRGVETKINGEKVTLIPLPATSAADLAYPVTIILEGKLDRGLSTSFGLFGTEISIPAPQIIDRQSSPEFGVVVSHTRWTVYTPEDIMASLVKRNKKSNLNYETDVEREAIYEKALISEVTSLNWIISKSNTSKNNFGVNEQQLRAADNLKQLQVQLNERLSRSNSNSEYDTDQSDRFGSEQIKLLINDTERNSAQFYQRSLQIGDGTTVLNGKSFIEGQNRFNISNNSIGIVEGEVQQYFFEHAESISSEGVKPAAKQEGKDFLSFKGRQRSNLDDAKKSQIDELNVRQQAETIQDLPGNKPISENLSKQLKSSTDDGQALRDKPREYEVPVDEEPASQMGLQIDLPVSGRKVAFTKVGGEPLLTLKLQSQRSSLYLLSCCWLTAWLTLCGLVCYLMKQLTWDVGSMRSISIMAICFGAFLFFLTQLIEIQLFGLAVVCVGLITVIWTTKRPPRVV